MVGLAKLRSEKKKKGRRGPYFLGSSGIGQTPTQRMRKKKRGSDPDESPTIRSSEALFRRRREGAMG